MFENKCRNFNLRKDTQAQFIIYQVKAEVLLVLVRNLSLQYCMTSQYSVPITIKLRYFWFQQSEPEKKWSSWVLITIKLILNSKVLLVLATRGGEEMVGEARDVSCCCHSPSAHTWPYPLSTCHQKCRNTVFKMQNIVEKYSFLKYEKYICSCLPSAHTQPYPFLSCQLRNTLAKYN